MIPFARVPLVVVLGLIAALAVGVVFGPLTPAFDDLSLTVWLVVLIELVIYFLATLLCNSEVGGGRALVVALFLCLTRLGVSAVAGMILLATMDLPLEQTTLLAWVGNPAGAFIQVFILMLVAPHAVSAFAPGLVSDSMQSVMEGHRIPARPATPMGRPEYGRHAEPVGGFIQVFSIKELQSMFRKSVGMEGFILYTSEGLVLWKDMPIRLDVDSLVARAHALGESMAGMVEGFGLTRVRKIVLESREHYIFHTRLNTNFGLIMVFASSIRIDDCWARLGVMARTTKEFLEWKYPNLGTLRQIPMAPAAAET